MHTGRQAGTAVTVIVKFEPCDTASCWCRVATDKHGTPLPVKRELTLEQVPAALAGVELDGHRGHRATAWIDATDTSADKAHKARNRGCDYQPLARSASWVTVPRTVRASSGTWRGESNGDKWERNVIESWAR
jgi:hypothetical protein